MPAAETARLIASLELNDRKFGAGVDRSIGKLGRLEGRLGALGGVAKRGVATAATNIARIGAVAAVGIGAAIKTGLDDLATLEDATRSVDGAIAQMGLTGKATSGQIAAWANQIEADIGAAFDDKAITGATATLLRFGKLAPANIRPAMVVMTDLATKTGSVDSAASLLAKALADPTKAAGKLARAGVILTKEQQKQIKSFVKAGKEGKAQKVILDALAESTKGAAEASQGPYRRSISLLSDTFEDARKALAEGFLPLIERFSGEANAFLAKPETIQRIREFGQRLADAAEAGIEFAKKIPWGTIGDGLRTAADWAGKLFDAFRNLPPEVQTTIIALAGLNKLSGGAVSGIVAELGKGLIKGVLGINAGVVNVNGGVVNGPGPGMPGGPGGTPGGAPGGKPGGGPGTIVPRIGASGSGIPIAELHDYVETHVKPEILRRERERMKPRNRDTFERGTVRNDPTGFLNSGPAQSPGKWAAAITAEQAGTTGAVDKVRSAQVATAAAVVTQGSMASKVAATAGVITAGAARAAGYTTAAAMTVAANRIVGAVNALDLSVNVTTVNRTTTVNNRYGPSGGSRDTGRTYPLDGGP